MINEVIILNKLENIKNNSKKILQNKYMDQNCFEYFLNELIKFIKENVEEDLLDLY